MQFWENWNLTLINTGHGHLGWTLSAVTADMVGGVVHDAFKPSVLVAAGGPQPIFQA